MTGLRVIGVGTCHGDDQAGLAVAAALGRCQLPARTQVLICLRPGADLVDAISGAEGIVIVDAMRTGSRPGTVRRIATQEVGGGKVCSTHGIGVRDAIELAAALGRLPARLAMVGIEATDLKGDRLSPAVRVAIDRASAFVVEILEEMRSGRRACRPG